MTDPIRVVLADDHTLVRVGTEELLAKHDDIVVMGTADNGVSAVALIAEHRPDVALIDISMPGLNGIEVTRRVKAEFSEVAVLILTVHDEPGYVRALIEAGAAGYLLKDIGESELVRSIRAVHSGEAVLHPAATRNVFQAIIAGGGHFDAGESSPLSERELDVLRLAARGRSNKEIAGDMEVSPRTVQTHLRNIFEKLGVASRTEAVIRALRLGWFDLKDLE